MPLPAHTLLPDPRITDRRSAQLLDRERLGLHLPFMTRLATSITGSAADAEDLVQETLERVLRRPRVVHGGERAYLARALRNTWVSMCRSAWRRPPAATFDATDRTGGVHHDTHRLAAREVLAAVAEQPAVLRDAVVAVDLAGLSYEQAAEALGVPTGTVFSRVHRGRGRVMRALAA
jgi:RNA polymerase sigma-70 factor (ECF subfamily)